MRRILEESSAQLESEWSDEEAAVSEPLLADRDSTGYTTDDPALENISMIHEAGLTDAEGRSSHSLSSLTLLVVALIKAAREISLILVQIFSTYIGRASLCLPSIVIRHLREQDLELSTDRNQ